MIATLLPFPPRGRYAPPPVPLTGLQAVHAARLAEIPPGRERDEFHLLALELERIAAAKAVPR